LGVRPQYMTICLMLPPGTKDDLLETIWKQIHEECHRLGIAIVGGHTGIYPGIAFPLNGGCTVFGIGEEEQLTPASNARTGDRVIITKGPAIEATGVLAYQAEAALSKKFGQALVDRAKSHLLSMTVVEEALLAAPYAHAMHDATEGGLLNGVYEVAAASNKGVTIYEDRIPVLEEVSAVCSYFGIDPLVSISEGTLVITATPRNAKTIISRLKRKGIKAWEIGEVTSKDRIFVRSNGRKEELTPVAVDPFWKAYFSTLEPSK
ncbi:MAG: AIR synthase-related protein, partial [Dehalococcoidia bacterium]|nr:AIR synthase-related protein [Dehalococcoidia bacterium]